MKMKILVEWKKGKPHEISFEPSISQARIRRLRDRLDGMIEKGEKKEEAK